MPFAPWTAHKCLDCAIASDQRGSSRLVHEHNHLLHGARRVHGLRSGSEEQPLSVGRDSEGRELDRVRGAATDTASAGADLSPFLLSRDRCRDLPCPFRSVRLSLYSGLTGPKMFYPNETVYSYFFQESVAPYKPRQMPYTQRHSAWRQLFVTIPPTRHEIWGSGLSPTSPPIADGALPGVGRTTPQFMFPRTVRRKGSSSH